MDETVTQIYAHSVKDRPFSEWETLAQHAEAVANRASVFAAPFSGSQVAGLLGWVHDLGKMKPRFQAKLSLPNDEPHSGEGARLLQQRFGKLGPLFAACVAGHHSCLPDLADMLQRLNTVPDLTPPDWMPIPDTLTPFGPLASGEISHFFNPVCDQDALFLFGRCRRT
jgi:CRISPR-associated endonuclease/helicase Cas3